jgi:hypothetical protein
VNNAPYNPLDTRNLGASVAEALLERVPQPLGEVQPFAGAGIYVIYYTGDLPIYAPITEANRKDQWRWPIYIGKAVPTGARKAISTTSKGRPLFNRLSEHADSVTLAANLEIEDFYCRYLVVEDIWIPLGESLLIAKFKPIWNRLVDGFGNHDPGKGRYAGMRPRWDVLHPGRVWAEKCAPRIESAELIASEVESHLRTAPAPPAQARILLSAIDLKVDEPED